MKKRIVSLLLVLALCLCLLAACAKSEKPAANDTPAEAPAQTEAPAQSEAPASHDELPYQDEEIVIYLMYTNDFSELAMVEAKINELTRAKLGLSVEMHGFSMGEYSTQLSLAISGGEAVDLACLTPIPGSTFASVTASNQAMDISGLIEAHCPTVLEVMGDFMGAFKIGSAVYGLPIAREKASFSYFSYRTDIAEELGVVDALDSAAKWEDLTPVFQIVRDNTDLYPLAGSRCLNGRMTGFWNHDSMHVTAYDTIGDQISVAYGAEDGTAKSLVENEDYLYMIRLLADWNNAGFAWADTATNSELTSTQLIENGTSFCEFLMSEGDMSNAAGRVHACTGRQIGDGIITSTAMTIWSMFVPATSKSPEAALGFVEMAYTDPALITLLDFGVEGEHYVLNDAGEACYLPGETAEDCGYHNMDWMFGNSFLLPPWEGQGADYRAQKQQMLRESVPSPFLGFVLDTSEMSEMVAALSSVYEEYGHAMLSGLYSESLFNEYKNKLDAAGLEAYIAEMQSQIDAWHSAR